jgi:mannose-6-phosphate isomerase-like protein (cupin superfamily)
MPGKDRHREVVQESQRRKEDTMAGFNKNIIELAEKNEFFRQVVVTSEYSQVVLMAIKPGEDIGEETHDVVDQSLFFVSGTGRAELNGQASTMGPNSLVVVPAGTLHNFINTGETPLKLVTVYAPPEHEPGTVHKTKAEALAAEHN